MILHLYNRKIAIALITLLFASLACSLPWLSKNPNELVIVPTLTSVAVQEVPNDSNTKDDEPYGKQPFSYQISEHELTSIISDELAGRDDIRISNPKVYLRDGIIELSGQYQHSGMDLPLEIKLMLFVDSNNQLQYEIVSAKVGPFPLPEYALDQLTEYLDQVIENNLSIQKESIVFEQVLVDNGLLMIKGYYR